MRPGRINYPYIVTHLLASVLLMVGIRQFAFLSEYNIIQNLSEYGIHEVIRTTNARDMMNLYEWLFIGTFFGLHVSVIISVIIMLRKKVSIVNPLIVFMGSALLLGLNFFRFEAVLNVRDSVGHLFHGNLLPLKYVVPGICFVILGLIVFFNPWIKKLPARPMLQYS